MVSSIAAAPLDDVRAWQQASRTVYCSKQLLQYIAEIVRCTRAAAECGELASGAGPRAGLAILRAAQARAILKRRNYVLPGDVWSVALGALRHRVTFAHSYLLARTEREEMLREIVARVPPP